MLGLQRILDADALQDFRREVGQARKAHQAALRQAVADAQHAMVRNADDVARIGLFGQFAVRGKEHDGGVHRQLLAGVLYLQLHAALEAARGHAEHGDAVAVVGVHIGLNLEDEAGDFVGAGLDRDVFGRGGVAGFGRRLLAGGHGLGRRGPFADGLQQFLDAEVAQGRAPQHGRHMAFQKRLTVERLIARLDQLQRIDHVSLLRAFEEGGGVCEGQGRGVFAVVVGGLAGVGLEPALAADLGQAAQAVAALGRPPDGGGVQLQAGRDLVQQGHRILGFAVQLVDEGDDRDVAQAADLEQLQRLRLDALGGVQHHDGAVGGGQGAIGVFREVLVARRVQQVEHLAVVFERHDRGGDRNAPLLLDLHPVRARPAVLAARLDRPGRAHGAARQQDVLGQGRLTGVRVGDDGEGPTAVGLLGESQFGHRASFRTRDLPRRAPIVDVHDAVRDPSRMRVIRGMLVFGRRRAMSPPHEGRETSWLWPIQARSRPYRTSARFIRWSAFWPGSP